MATAFSKDGRTAVTTINRFDGGMQNELRSNKVGALGVVKHFDFYTSPFKLTPYRSTEADEAKSQDIVKFVYTPFGASGFRLLGFGKAAANTASAVFSYDIDANTPDSSNWDTLANNEGTTVTRDEGVFFYYKNFVYMWAGGSSAGVIGRFGDLTGTPSFTNAFKTINYNDVAQPVHHPDRDIAYFFSDNKVHKWDGTTWNDGAGDVTVGQLVLPDNLIIKSATVFGNYLAIGCTTKQTLDRRSMVFLWDMDSVSWSVNIDFGEGELFHLAELDGALIGVIDFYSSNAFVYDKPRVIIKKSFGNTAVTVSQLVGTDTAASLEDKAGKQIRQNRLLFARSMELDGVDHLGVWSVNSNGDIGIELIEEDASSIQGFWFIAETWFIAHSNDGSINRTDNSLNYNFKSVYESVIFNDSDSSRTKKLVGVKVMFDPLPAAGSVLISYKADAETSFTTIFTHTTDNAISHAEINTAAGANLPDYKEIQFRIESTGGAIITGFKFKSEFRNKDPF